MNRRVVLMASHLGSPERYITIKRALKSIFNSTLHPHLIFISYSCCSNVKDEQVENEWKDIFKMSKINLYIFFKTEKTPQFYHYDSLRFLIEDDDIVSFLDDDDLFHPQKIEIVFQKFQDHNFNVKVVVHTMNVFGAPWDSISENDENDVLSTLQVFPASHSEYFCYTVKGNVFKTFFQSYTFSYGKNNMDINLLDLCFKIYVDECYKDEMVKIDDRLVFMRKHKIKKDYIC
jgi:hypothetical protein